jgi:hypothetical protein
MHEPDARLTLANDCADNTYALLAAVYKQAIKDAWLGDVGATVFLDTTAPGWQALSAQHQTERTGRARRRATRQTDGVAPVNAYARLQPVRCFYAKDYDTT